MNLRLQALDMGVGAGWHGCLVALVRHALAAVLGRVCTSIQLHLLPGCEPELSSRCSYRSAGESEAQIAV